MYEPVGAAFFYARELDRDATILVADFGGGTSDFSVMRFSQSGGSLRATPLSHTGIGIAGDAFDYRIVDKVVSPRLGKGGSYRSMGKVLTLPNRHYANLARWNQLAMMKGSGDLQELKDLAKDALDPEPLQKFIDIIEYDLGFALYRAVSAAKWRSRSRTRPNSGSRPRASTSAPRNPRRVRGMDRGGCCAH